MSRLSLSLSDVFIDIPKVSNCVKRNYGRLQNAKPRDYTAILESCKVLGSRNRENISLVPAATEGAEGITGCLI